MTMHSKFIDLLRMQIKDVCTIFTTSVCAMQANMTLTTQFSKQICMDNLFLNDFSHDSCSICCTIYMLSWKFYHKDYSFFDKKTTLSKGKENMPPKHFFLPVKPRVRMVLIDGNTSRLFKIHYLRQCLPLRRNEYCCISL